ncbi:hypothetical protein [Streptomyces marianii]|uniref:Uncharacterized protein n=1 Tax=Streptomyces marianii TaxID=1817406 RepID=A0A5R9DSH0_9ACTN|nr:hypothetical protein [Streptomyces marianii]TLQ38964.1 hypothetical protein FEF34_39795 [Streptomyces marianii]
MNDDDQPIEHRRIECSDCQADPDTGWVRQSWIKDGVFTELWHTQDCPQYVVEQILGEDSARRMKERDAWAEKAFPAAHDRLAAAATDVAADSPAAPFVAALTDLVAAQAGCGGGFLTLDKWAEILERHFPPQEPDARGN